MLVAFPVDYATEERPPLSSTVNDMASVVNLVLLKCRKLRREDQETSDWIVSMILLLRTTAVGICSHRNLNLK